MPYSLDDWNDVDIITPETDLEVICCECDDVFFAFYRGHGLFEVNGKHVGVDYWMDKPDSFYQMEEEK